MQSSHARLWLTNEKKWSPLAFRALTWSTNCAKNPSAGGGVVINENTRFVICSNGNANLYQKFESTNATSSKNAALGASPRQLSTALGRAATSFSVYLFLSTNDRSQSRTNFSLGVPPLWMCQYKNCLAALTSSWARSSEVLYTVDNSPPASDDAANNAKNRPMVVVLPC